MKADSTRAENNIHFLLEADGKFGTEKRACAQTQACATRSKRPVFRETREEKKEGI